MNHPQCRVIGVDRDSGALSFWGGNGNDDSAPRKRNGYALLAMNESGEVVDPNTLPMFFTRGPFGARGEKKKTPTQLSKTSVKYHDFISALTGSYPDFTEVKASCPMLAAYRQYNIRYGRGTWEWTQIGTGTGWLIRIGPVSDQFQTGVRPVSDQCQVPYLRSPSHSPSSPPYRVHVAISCQMHSLLPHAQKCPVGCTVSPPPCTVLTEIHVTTQKVVRFSHRSGPLMFGLSLSSSGRSSRAGSRV